MTKRVRVAVTGAAGQIGYALLFRIASGQMFGMDTEVELNLLELPAAMPALEGVCMELHDCAFPLLRAIRATSDLNTAMDGANWVILVGAIPRKAGMERGDLLQKNGAIFIEQGRAINQSAADDVRVLVVGNPCNTNARIAATHAPDVPDERFFAMTMLDELRAKAQLAIQANAHVQDIKHMTIWGNHSATQYPDFYHATLGGRAVTDVIDDTQWLSHTFIETVQKRGAAIIQARGASSAASAANAIVSNVYALTHDTPADDTFSVCIPATGQYGIDDGLFFSFPCRVSNGQLSVVEGIEHNAFGQEKIAATLDELRGELAAIKQLKLI